MLIFQALIQCAANSSFIGAQVGAVAILHTWGLTLVYHPHIHMIVPAGGLSEDQMEWIDSVFGQLHPQCGFIYGNVQHEAEVTVML